MNRLVFLVAFISCAAFAMPQAVALVEPQERMQDPALEARAQALYLEVSCPSCAGQAIANSRAETAAALRAAVRERLKNGDSDQVIRDWLRARFGDDILLRPQVGPQTALLWGLPLFFIAVAAAFFVIVQRKRNKK